MTQLHPEMHERRILTTELLWAFGVGVLIAAVLSTVMFTALTMGINPPSNVERLDPKTLHLSGEFAEHNLGTTVASDGAVVVRVIATQFMFVPQCIAVPKGRPVTLRLAAPDVIHGILVTGTNVNTMVVPGYVAQVHTEFTRTGDLLMPCHEYCGLGHSEMWATVQVMTENEFKPGPTGGLPVRNVERLCLAHFWVAFAAFVAACVLGTWQMWVRSPLGANVGTPGQYFMSVTAHGVAMAYVLTTFFIMGFGYFVAVTALARALPGRPWAWFAFWMAIVGVVMTLIPILTGQASVLFTFYPPLTASSWFYFGLVLLVVASWIWCVLMIVAMREWKGENPGRPVPLAMFATVANAVMWLWTTFGVTAELLFQVIPAAVGLTQTIDVGLARTLFSWTLHAIVYFWLLPAYIAFYTMVPRAAGGRLYSDTMGRLTFILFLVYSLPVGMHHLMMDPEHGNGWKFIQVLLTAFVSVPTLLTIFTIAASLEIAGRLRGGRGLLGWIAALPWQRPMVLATGLAFVMLGFGGFGGLINMGYGMNAMVHNTSWVTAHFHLIFGGSVVIMYFAIAYEIWPRLTGREHVSPAPLRLQLWLWFIGMMVMTLPWHWLGLEGQWRRVANFNYADPIIAGWGPWVVVSLGGGGILLISALLFARNLLVLHRSPALAIARPLYALAVHPPQRVPAALNGFGLWNVLVLVLMLAAYGYPIAQFVIEPSPAAIVHRVR